MDNRVGEQFGNYRLIQLLGQGGFADVYLGQHISLDTRVAIKVLHTQIESEEVESFFAQIQSIAHLDHPHIVRILEVGMENDIPFLVMDYAPHGNLRQRHPKGTQLPLATVVSYVKQIADALQYVHDQNLIHRDINPRNMLLGPNNEVLLSDFGIAVLAQTMGYRLQTLQDFEGTIPYAAPEQIRSRPRIASDQYALGIVVYEWLSGDWPFHGTASEIASQHTLTPPPSLHEKVPTLSPAVEQVLIKALEKDPYQRFENVQAFAKALEQASRLEQPHLQSKLHMPLPFTLPMKTPSSETASLLPQATYHTYRGHSESVHAVAWSPDGQHIASSSLDETVQIWDALTDSTTLTYRSNSLKAQAIAWSPAESAYIASTSGLLSEKVEIWDVTTGRISEYPIYNGHAETVHALAWSPNGEQIVSADDKGIVQVWNVVTGQTVCTYRAHSSAVQDVAWSPDGSLVASVSADKTVHVWDATTARNILIYYGHRDKVNAVAWSPDGSRIASASADKTIHVWDATSGHKIFTYSGHTGGVTALAWSPTDLRIASSSLDETVQVWDAATGKHMFTYEGHSDWVSDVAWSPDGKYIASSSWDKTVQVWEAK